LNWSWATRVQQEYAMRRNMLELILY